MQLLKGKADKAQSMELAAITAAVDQAVKDKRITEAKRDHFIQLGKNVGVQQLAETLECMAPATKPLNLINKETARLLESIRPLPSCQRCPPTKSRL